MTNVDFDAAYRGVPPWDIGRPQPAIAAAAEAGALRGRVLDVGCGTGEHALLAAAHGLESMGIDASPAAIDRAKAKAVTRGLSARFLVADALALHAAETGTFDTIIDTGLFHVFDDAPRERYVRSLEGVTQAGSMLLLMCFSDRGPLIDGGPRRVSESELRTAFDDGWEIMAIEPREFTVVSLPFDSFPAWLATIVRR